MASLSLSLLIALNLLYRPIFCAPQEALAPVTAPAQFLQSGPAPDLAQSASAAVPACGGCYLVADVAGLVWYSEVFIHTAATAVVSVGNANGTSATRTSIMQNEGVFTYNAANPNGDGGGALTQLAFNPTTNVGGALLTSPTAYNVFTAYSITSAFESNGICVTSSGTQVKLSSAYTEILQSANGKVILDANGQQQFIDFLGFTTCSGGGVTIAPTALIPITNTTATLTRTFSNVPLAAALATLTIAPQSVPASVSAAATTSAPAPTTFPSAAVPLIVVGNKTITPSPNPIGLPVYNGTFVGTATNLGGSSVIILPTGTVAFNSTPSVIAFIGSASLTRGDAWLATVWGAGIMALGALVYYL